MKKLSVLLFLAVFAFAACDKADDMGDLSLKKKPTNNNGTGGGGGGGQTPYQILAPNNEDPLYINIGETVQLTTTQPTLLTNWYVIDQQIAYVYWDGRVEGRQLGTTVVSAFHYQQTGQPLQDNIVVYVVQ